MQLEEKSADGPAARAVAQRVREKRPSEDTSHTSGSARSVNTLTAHKIKIGKVGMWEIPAQGGFSSAVQWSLC